MSAITYTPAARARNLDKLKQGQAMLVDGYVLLAWHCDRDRAAGEVQTLPIHREDLVSALDSLCRVHGVDTSSLTFTWLLAELAADGHAMAQYMYFPPDGLGTLNVSVWSPQAATGTLIDVGAP